MVIGWTELAYFFCGTQKTIFVSAFHVSQLEVFNDVFLRAACLSQRSYIGNSDSSYMFNFCYSCKHLILLWNKLFSFIILFFIVGLAFACFWDIFFAQREQFPSSKWPVQNCQKKISFSIRESLADLGDIADAPPPPPHTHMMVHLMI